MPKLRDINEYMNSRYIGYILRVNYFHFTQVMGVIEKSLGTAALKHFYLHCFLVSPNITIEKIIFTPWLTNPVLTTFAIPFNLSYSKYFFNCIIHDERLNWHTVDS